MCPSTPSTTVNATMVHIYPPCWRRIRERKSGRDQEKAENIRKASKCSHFGENLGGSTSENSNHRHYCTRHRRYRQQRNVAHENGWIPFRQARDRGGE